MPATNGEDTDADKRGRGAQDDARRHGFVEDGDTVVENLDEGIDTVQTSVTWVLANDLENLNLTGSNPINGTGNALDNVLTGNSAANVSLNPRPRSSSVQLAGGWRIK